MKQFSQQEVSEYYEDLTKFINENSGLDAVDAEQVKWTCRLSKKFENDVRSKTRDKSRDLTIGGKYADRRENPRCCTAKRTDGEPCRRYSVKGASVCRVHGGSAKQIVNAARIRLQNASFQMAKELLNMATDENVSDAVKLKAITEALDRGGVATKSSVEVGISVAPHESIFEQMMTGSRAAYRGETDSDQNPPALVATDHDAIDVAIVEDDLDGDNPANLDVMAYPITPDGYETRSPFDSSPSPFDVEPPATDALMPLDQANAELARLRAAHTPPGHAVSHRGQRALPRGRS